MKFCRINLSKTNYQLLEYAHLMSTAEKDDRADQLIDIYHQYCDYKKFTSVMPLFKGIIFDRYTDIFAYHPNKELSAFSIVKKYDSENVESIQFAWDYKNPNLFLGIKSLEHECAYYKQQGYKYLYLGLVADYKKEFDGYEEMGPLDSNLHLTTSS
jgi:hypothetical protein